MKNKLKETIALLFFLLSVYSYAQEFEASSKPLRINFTTKDVHAPDVFLVYKNRGVINAKGKVEVEIRVFDVSGISHVVINSEERMEEEPMDSVKFDGEFVADEEVLVIARDNFNNVNQRTFIIKGQDADVSANTKSKRKYYALLIGVNDYADEKIESLDDPIKDASLLKEVITKKYTFEEEDITFLKNPTFEEIIVEFDILSRKITPEDFLLIFYAGHGVFDEKTNIGYWLPSDASEKNKAKWFRNSTLVENIGAINSKHTLLIADACFSGGIFKTRTSNNNASVDISNMMKYPSRKAITSGSLTKVPDKSIFMKYLLKSLEENPNKYFPSEELYDEVRRAMKSNSTTKPLFGEIQNAGDEGGNFVLIQRN